MSSYNIILSIAILLFSFQNTNDMPDPILMDKNIDSPIPKEEGNDEVTIHKVWKLKDIKYLHPIFAAGNSSFWGEFWVTLDLTAKDILTYVPRDIIEEGKPVSVPYRILDDKLILEESTENRVKDYQPFLRLISKLTDDELRIKIHIEPTRKKNKLEGDFVEFVYEEKK